MVGLGVAICSYNMLGIWMYVGQTKQFLRLEQRNKDAAYLGHLKKSDVQLSHYTQWKALYQTKSLNRTWAYKLNENAHNALCPRRLVWMSETSTQIKLINV